MTNVTDELQHLLDERGVEYDKVTENGRTTFKLDYAEECCDYLNEISVVGECIAASKAYLTPEQAIAATLGGGECELAEVDSYSNACEVVHVLECSACGQTCEHVNGSYPKCPHCGRSVKR